MKPIYIILNLKFFAGVLFLLGGPLMAGDLNAESEQPDTKPYYTLNDANIQNVECFIIRNIVVENRDIFAPGIDGGDDWKERWVGRTANLLHLKTRKQAVRNELMFGEGDEIDVYRLRESERLLRKTGLFVDAKIRIYPLPNLPGRAEIRVITQDHWSFEMPVSFKPDSKSGYFSLSDENFWGFGHDIRAELAYDQEAQVDWSGGFDYVFSNYKGSHYDIELNWDRNNVERVQRRLDIRKPFYSPLTRWASSLELGWIQDHYTRRISPDSTADRAYSLFNQDLWIGRSFRLKWSHPLFDKNDQIVGAARLYNLYYKDGPKVSEDANREYENRITLLASLGLTTRDYHQDYYFNRFGVTEDIPVGHRLTYTWGVEKGKFDSREYNSGDYLIALNIKRVGYLAAAVSASGFKKDDHWKQSQFQASLDYVSPLKIRGDWKFRFFVKSRLLQGYHRFSDEWVYLNYKSGLRAISGKDAPGVRRLTINLESHIFSPWTLRKTRFGLNIYADAGLIGGDEYGTLSKSRLYQSYGLGLRIRNRALYKGTIELGAAITPYDPGDDGMGYRIWMTTRARFKFLDFGLPKPSIWELGS